MLTTVMADLTGKTGFALYAASGFWQIQIWICAGSESGFSGWRREVTWGRYKKVERGYREE